MWKHLSAKRFLLSFRELLPYFEILSNGTEILPSFHPTLVHSSMSAEKVQYNFKGYIFLFLGLKITDIIDRFIVMAVLNTYITHYTLEHFFVMNPHICLSVGQSVGQSVCHNFLRGREKTLSCSYRNTCLISSHKYKRDYIYCLTYRGTS